MSSTSSLRVAVLYNHVGVDEYETLRTQVKEGMVPTPDGGYDLEDIATLREEIQAVMDALLEEGYDAYAVNVEDRWDRLHDALTHPRPEVVFNLIEWFNDNAGQEDRVAALYDLLRIPYTGAAPFTLALCQRKALVKQILKANDVPTPRYNLVKGEPIPKLTSVRYPVIVKPSREDASAGVTEASVVEDRPSLEARVRHVLKEFDQPVLVEEFIAGREIAVSILGNDPPRVLPIEEMDFSALPDKYRGIISFESKWDPLHEAFQKADVVCPAVLPRAVERRANMLALRVYELLGCRDYARVDMRMDRKNRLYVLEVNPNPDLTEGVAFMNSARVAGLSFGATLKVIVEAARRRVPAAPSRRTEVALASDGSRI